MMRQLWKRVKHWLWVRRNAANPLMRAFARGAWDFFGLLREVKGLFTSANTRSVVFMKLFQRDRAHQTTAATGMDRYPEIFSACRSYLAGKENLRILSFGCATGEEVFTLRRYFPKATIVGAEINRHSLAVCRSRNQDENIHFIDSTQEKLAKFGPYDAIFCMAVFQRNPDLVYARHIMDLKKIYPFEKFERQIVALEPLVKEDGLLVIHYSQYDLSDTAAASCFTPWGDCCQNEYGPFVFGPDSKRKKQWLNRPCIFVKNAEKKGEMP